MSSTFQTSARIFPCANCGEMIYSDSPTCRFCHAPVDHQAAEAAANNQKHVNDAINLAKWIRNVAGAMWVFVLGGLIFGLLSLGATVCIFLIPASLIYWQIKYEGVKTADPDFKKTRRDRLIALLLWLPASIVQLLLIVVRILL